MKSTLIIFTLLFLVSCASNQNAPLTQDEKLEKELGNQRDYRI